MDTKITPLPWAGRDDRITTQGGRLLASVWQRSVDDEQEPGESWLAMRERTQPERDAAKAETHANAAFIVKAVNMHAQLVAALRAAEQDNYFCYLQAEVVVKVISAINATEGK